MRDDTAGQLVFAVILNLPAVLLYRRVRNSGGHRRHHPARGPLHRWHRCAVWGMIWIRLAAGGAVPPVVSLAVRAVRRVRGADFPDAQPERSRQSFLFCRHVYRLRHPLHRDQHADYRNFVRAHAGPNQRVMLTTYRMIGSKSCVDRQTPRRFPWSPARARDTNADSC